MFASPRTLARLVAVTAVSAVPLLLAAPAHADVTRCVGSPDAPGASACYTSPRFDHVGLARTSVATVPVVCYGLGCTGAQLLVFQPTDTFAGRFTEVSYLGNTYTVYRPADGQAAVVKSNSGTFQPLEDLQALLLSVALDASRG